MPCDLLGSSAARLRSRLPCEATPPRPFTSSAPDRASRQAGGAHPERALRRSRTNCSRATPASGLGGVLTRSGARGRASSDDGGQPGGCLRHYPGGLRGRPPRQPGTRTRSGFPAPGWLMTITRRRNADHWEQRSRARTRLARSRSAAESGDLVQQADGKRLDPHRRCTFRRVWIGSAPRSCGCAPFGPMAESSHSSPMAVDGRQHIAGYDGAWWRWRLRGADSPGQGGAAAPHPRTAGRLGRGTGPSWA